MKKRILPVLLILALALTVAACGANGGTEPPATQPPATQPPVTPPPAGGGTIGFVTDDVDHWARDPYHIIYYNFTVTQLTAQMADAIARLGEVFNFTVEHQTANGDADLYITNLQTILMREPDGLVIDVQTELAPRVAEILDSFGVPAVAMLNRAADADGNIIIPSVVLDQYDVGRTQIDFLYSVYSDFWGDIDTSRIGLLSMDFSANVEINRRSLGAEERWNQLFPGQPFFHGDTAAFGLSAEAGDQVANSIISANPDIEYWWVVGATEDITLGATRAVESLGLEDRVLITSIGVAVLPREWDAGYDGIWFAIYYVPPVTYIGTAVFGLLALIDGRATFDTLWSEFLRPGDRAAGLLLDVGMVTRDQYHDHIRAVMNSFGLEP